MGEFGGVEAGTGRIVAGADADGLRFDCPAGLDRVRAAGAEHAAGGRVDGATWFQKFIWITIPQTKSIIEFYVIITLIEMLSWVFNFIYVMTSGGPGNKTTVLEYLIYKKSFGGGDFNIAMAISVMLLLLAGILVILHQIVLRKED